MKKLRSLLLVVTLGIVLSACKLTLIQNNEFEGNGVKSTDEKEFSFDPKDIFGGITDAVDSAAKFGQDITDTFLGFIPFKFPKF